MKKLTCLLLTLLLCSQFLVAAVAAPEGPVITLQPQNPCYPEYSVAIYTVKATGNNLQATWYIQFEGKTYNASEIGGAMQPWEAYAGESYGAKKIDENTFCFVFEGIGGELNGAEIWCVIEDGHYDVVSQHAYINLGNPATPPEILDIPAQITVTRGQEAEIRCIARSNSEAQLGYIWYETPTGQLPDIVAMDRGTEYGDFILCDTSQVGTRYYVCAVNTSQGGITYSGVVAVNVVESTAVAAPQIQTTTLPDATVGTQYSLRIQCSDPEAEFFPYYNPGGKNDLAESNWLGLSADGWLMGTPMQAGTYGFSICATGAGGEDYMTYTLTVKEAAEETISTTTEATAGATEPVENTQSVEATAESLQETESQAGVEQVEEAGSSEWLTYVLIAVAGLGLGVGAAVLLTKRKK